MGRVETKETVFQLVRDLETGRQFLQRKRRQVNRRLSRERPQQLDTNTWWMLHGRDAFLAAAQTWKETKGADLARLAGTSIEDMSAEMTHGECIEELTKAFKKTYFQPIRLLDIVLKMRSEARMVKERLGAEGVWIGQFLNVAIYTLAATRKLKPDTTTQLRLFAIQPMLNLGKPQTKIS